MKTFIVTALAIVVCVSTAAANGKTNQPPDLKKYIKEVAAELELVPKQRRVILREIAEVIVGQLQDGKEAKLTFICTHNSRRSHMSQIWSQTAAHHYGLDKVTTYSGGTEATACNCRTVTAMRRAGFKIVDATDPEGENPLYLVHYAQDRSPIRAYSKIYNSDDNPKKDFIALMTCSSADKSCPVVEGAIARFPIHYMDPRLCDDTPLETQAYKERCRQIAREMFFIMNEVRGQMK